MWLFYNNCADSNRAGFESHKLNSESVNPFEKNTDKWYSWNNGYNNFYNTIEYKNENSKELPTG